jgi:hypothetical protein
MGEDSTEILWLKDNENENSISIYCNITCLLGLKFDFITLSTAVCCKQLFSLLFIIFEAFGKLLNEIKQKLLVRPFHYYNPLHLEVV